MSNKKRIKKKSVDENIKNHLTKQAKRAFKDSSQIDFDHAVKTFKRMNIATSLALEASLKNKTSQSLVALMIEVYDEIERSFRNMQEQIGKRVTCKAGCYYCCYQKIGITMPEFLVIDSVIKNSDVLPINKDKIMGSTIVSIHDNEWKYFGDPCGFLDRNICTIYPVRPLMCRAWHVFNSSENCRKKYLEKEDCDEIYTDLIFHCGVIQESITYICLKFKLTGFIQLEKAMIHSFQNNIFQDWINKKI